MSVTFCYLNGKNIDAIKGYQIYLVGLYRKCFDDLCNWMDVSKDIKGVIDDKVYESYRSCVMRGNVFQVMCTKDIGNIPSNSVLLLLGSDYVFRCIQLSMLPAVKERFDVIYYFPNIEGRYTIFYQEKFRDLSLENIILFRSGTEASWVLDDWEYADNARALFEYMLENGFNEKYKLVWLVQNPNYYRLRYKYVKNVEFLPYRGATSDNRILRDNYYETICRAKYVFFCQTYHFARYLRKDQIRINLWHGCGFKTNYDVKESLRYEYMIVTSGFYAELHSQSFGLNRDQMLVTGLPKNDWIFHPLLDWRIRLNIPRAKKYIFWLPTYRTASDNDRMVSGVVADTSTGMPIIQTEEQFVKINEILQEFDILLLVKLHSAQDKTGILNWNLSNIMLLDNRTLLQEGVEINEIIGYADALISDYSSVATGYMLLDRPIAFTLDDHEMYHGFHWPKEELRNWLPGEEIFTYDDMAHFIKNVADGKDTSREKRHRLMPYFHKYCDDQSCARVLETLGIDME